MSIPLLSTEQGPGFDFVRDVMRDIHALAQSLAAVQETAGRLGVELQEERQGRQADVASLHERLSRETLDENERRVKLEAKLDAFEAQSKTWIGSLGKEMMIAKERLSAHDVALEERVNQQAAADTRIAKLEQALPLKSSIAELEKLASILTALKAEVGRDRVAADAAVKAVSDREVQDFRVIEVRLETLQRLQEGSRQALTNDIASVDSKVDGLAAVSAKAAEVQALERRTQEVERLLRTASEELGRKASAASLKAVSDRLTEATMEAQTHHNRWRADSDELAGKLDTLEKSLAKAERQLDADRERSSNCYVSLEKDLQTRATRVDTEKLARRVSTNEEAISRLEPAVAAKAPIDDVEQLRARTKHLETDIVTRADADEVARQARIIAEQGTEIDTVKRRTQQQGQNIDRLDAELRDHGNKLEAAGRRADELQAELERKVERGDVYTTAEVEENLRTFYRREEVDSLLSRVWWRLGDLSKGRVVNQAATTRA